MNLINLFLIVILSIFVISCSFKQDEIIKKEYENLSHKQYHSDKTFQTCCCVLGFVSLFYSGINIIVKCLNIIFTL